MVREWCAIKAERLLVLQVSPISAHRQTVGAKTRFRSPSNSTAVLNLNCSLVFSSSRSFCTFFKKYQKRGSRVRHSVLPLFTNCISISCCNILQSVHTSPLAACRNAWGGKNSLRSNIMPPVSKHCSATRCASQRCPLDKLLTLAAKVQTSLAFVRLRVTFALGDELPFAVGSSAHNGNSRKNRHRKQHN